MRQLGRLTAVTAGLSGAVDEVNRAAGGISGVSQSLAQGASEQAASLEETSASLEEMASMTRTNADNARQADALMGETARVVEDGPRLHDPTGRGPCRRFPGQRGHRQNHQDH
jgi:methyl-accepting chemotaxis protein